MDTETMQHISYYQMVSFTTDDNVQVRGMTVIQSVGGVSFSEIMKLSGSKSAMSEMQKERMEVLKDGLPLRLKKVIMLNAPWWMSILLAISKPFMGEKMRSRLHSVDNKGLVEHLDEQLIPQDLRHVSKS